MPRRPRPRYRARGIARYAKRSKGKNAQSKQIVSLARKVNGLAEISSVPLKLRWYRDTDFVDRLPLTPGRSGQLSIYICPIPVAPNAVGAATADFADTGPLALNPGNFKKAKIWVTATDVNQKPRCVHRGGYITYKLTRTNFSLRHYKVMLIRPKAVVADQLSLQRQMQFFDDAAAPGAPAIAGQASKLVEGYDYIHNPLAIITDPMTGFQMNPQMWDVLASHSYKFGTNKPFLRPELSPQQLANTIGNTMRTEATGYFKIPSGGAVHKIWSQDPTQQATNLDYKNQRSEKNVFLVIFQQRGSMIPTTEVGGNQPVADVPEGELQLNLQVRDNYSCSEGSLTPQTGGAGAYRNAQPHRRVIRYRRRY